MKLASSILLLTMAATSPLFAEQLEMQSAYPAALPVVGHGAQRFADVVAEVTNGELTVKVHGPGELSPLAETLENVGSGAIDAGWGYAGFWEGRAPAAALFGSIPFGPDATKYLAWINYGGGLEIWREVYAPFNVVPVPCGTIISEAAGWYTKEIKTPDDLKGINFRIGGLGGRIMANLGANPVLLPVGEVSTALETGRLDGVEISMPMIDVGLGFDSIAKYYYFPGWHQPAGMTELIINKDIWDGMSAQKQASVTAACAEVSTWMVGSTVGAQAEALFKIKEAGVLVQRFPDAVLTALRQAAQSVVEEQSAADPLFKKAIDSYNAFSAAYDEYENLSSLE